MNFLTDFFPRYLTRFNEEIATIKFKQSISKNRSNQHANRLSILEMNVQREKSEFEGAGMGRIEFESQQPIRNEFIQYFVINCFFILNFRAHKFVRSTKIQTVHFMGW